MSVSDFFKGTLGNDGGTVHVDTAGGYQLTASITDELDRVFSCTQTITITNTAPATDLTADVTGTYADSKFLSEPHSRQRGRTVMQSFMSLRARTQTIIIPLERILSK